MVIEENVLMVFKNIPGMHGGLKLDAGFVIKVVVLLLTYSDIQQL